jgi:hypothetical protein
MVRLVCSLICACVVGPGLGQAQVSPTMPPIAALKADTALVLNGRPLPVAVSGHIDQMPPAYTAQIEVAIPFRKGVLVQGLIADSVWIVDSTAGFALPLETTGSDSLRWRSPLPGYTDQGHLFLRARHERHVFDIVVRFRARDGAPHWVRFPQVPFRVTM